MTYKSDFLNILDQRGFIHQGSDLAGLDQKLTEGVQSAYIGFDATAKSLHVGNLTGIMMLYWFQQTGHKPITLMGGGTSKVGDPSFKDATRNLMDDATIQDNIENIRTTCFTQFLTYGDGPTDAIMVNNDDWLSELKYLDFLRDYGRYFTVNRMISFDSVKTRLERESPLTLLEFNYMVMQGYDFVELHRRYGTVLQMGGSDQWGNIINGVDLAHKADQVQLYALTAPLLLNSAGEKMGKTVNGAVWLNRNMLSSYDYWQYFRNVDDADVGNLLRRFTTLPMDEVRRLESLQGSEINEAKKILAFEATKMCRGEQDALDAAETARKTFEQGGAGDNLPSINLTFDEAHKISVLDLFLKAGLIKSKKQGRDRLKEGGLRIDNKKVQEDGLLTYAIPELQDDLRIQPDTIPVKLSSGQKNHVLVRIK